MRMLLIHADSMQYDIKKKTRHAEDLPEDFTGDKMDEVLVVFTAVESPDEDDPQQVVQRAAGEIQDVAGQVGVEKVLIYPYAHLSSQLSSPETAVEVLRGLESELDSGLEVRRAPFGYYKAFEISCKGHPLSELSRDIKLEGGQRDSQALEREEKIESSWYILTPEGDLVEPGNFDFEEYPDLQKFLQYERTKARAVDKVPPHVKLMQRLELADYEPGSDIGNLRWYPKGALVKRLLEEHVTDIARANGGMEVETPIMYDRSHPNLKAYIDRFPARQYTLESDRRNLFLRFAACFGQYLMKHDMSISYRNLPLRLYELTHYSFRREQRGEVVGLRRLRAFTMPDMHTLAQDMDQAIEEFVKQYQLCMGWMRDLGIDYQVGIRFVRDFFDENRDLPNKLASMVDKPVLIEMWDERSFYFVMKFEFNFIDALDKASALSTVQIDTENTKRFDIKYVDSEGEERFPLMLHASISGGIDRTVYALLEKAHLDQKNGRTASLPLWLSPTQLRICPVSDDHLGFAEKLAERVESSKIRVDIDDRSQSVGRKVRDAEREWVPYIVVVGDDERSSGLLPVRVRNSGEIEDMSLEKLVSRISAEVEGFPKRSLPLPRLLSRRPVFRG